MLTFNDLFGSVGWFNGRRRTISDPKIKAEIKMWKQLHHPNICRFITYTIEQSAVCFLVSELANGRDLFHVCAGHEPKLFEHPHFTVSLIRQIADALHYMHNHLEMVHGDIKPENILLHVVPTPRERKWRKSSALIMRRSDLGELLHETRSIHTYVEVIFQLGDFGSTKRIKDKHARKFGGTLQFIAPEFLCLTASPKSRAPLNPPSFDPRAQDMWAFGLTLWQICMHDDDPLDVYEVRDVLPRRYGGTMDISKSTPLIWSQTDLGDRFLHRYRQRYGVVPSGHWQWLIGGLTTFRIPARLRVKDLRESFHNSDREKRKKYMMQ